MKVTKFEHACFVVEQNDQTLVVDPGAFTTDFVIPQNVAAVVVTHEHPDHFDNDMLAKIIDKNPEAVIVAHKSITSQLANLPTQQVSANEGIKIGEFELEFYGGEHAVIIPERPVIPNLGVFINGRLYYPGDSFAMPSERRIEVLALPIGAPWLKISEVVEFLRQTKPRIAFPTHDAVLSDSGKSLPDRMIPEIAQQFGTTYQRLTEPLEI